MTALCYRLLTGLLLSGLIAGCSPDLRFQYLDELSPGHGVIDERSIEIMLGTAIGVRLLDGGSTFDDETDLELTSQAPEILAVAPTMDPDVFVFYGADQGATVVNVRFANEAYKDIPARVRAP